MPQFELEHIVPTPFGGGNDIKLVPSVIKANGGELLIQVVDSDYLFARLFEAGAPEVVLGAAVVEMGAEPAPAPVALAADVTAAATFTCVTGPLSPGLPIRTLTLTLVGEACTAVAAA